MYKGLNFQTGFDALNIGWNPDFHTDMVVVIQRALPCEIVNKIPTQIKLYYKDTNGHASDVTLL